MRQLFGMIQFIFKHEAISQASTLMVESKKPIPFGTRKCGGQWKMMSGSSAIILYQ